MKYFLASGQSNMVGRGAGGAFSISPLVQVWNNRNDLSNLTYLGDAWVDPDRDQPPFVGSFNNVAVQAANHYALATGEQVRLVIVAKAGQAISQWHNGTSRQAMLTRITAVLGSAGVSGVDGFWWLQGAGDNDEPLASAYQAKWNALVQCLTDDGLITSTTPIVIGEEAKQFLNTNQFLRTIDLADARVQRAPISRFDTSDDIHYTGNELIRAGLIFAALQKLIS